VRGEIIIDFNVDEPVSCLAADVCSEDNTCDAWGGFTTSDEPIEVLIDESTVIAVTEPTFYNWDNSEYCTPVS
jgi:hypothetical protein